MQRAFTLFFILVGASAVGAGQTTVFTYQGNLTVAGIPANGNYDFAFQLYSAASGGNPLGVGVSVNDVTVTNGSFTVPINFPSQFSGPDRYLETRVRPAGQGGFTTLAPRQTVTSSPYAIKSLNTELLAGIPANQYVLTNDTRLSDARTPLPNSLSYVQNRTTQQSGASFNIGGSGTIGGTLTVGDSSTFQKSVTVATDLDVGEKATIGGTTTIAGTLNAVQGNFTGAVNTASQFTVGGNFTLSRSRLSLFNTLAVPRGFSFEALNSPSYLVLKNDNGSTLMTITPAGRIGIGEPNPLQAALEVAGGLRVGGLGIGHVCADSLGVLQTCAALTSEVGDAAVKIAELERRSKEQAAEIDRYRVEVATLKEIVCTQNRGASICSRQK